MPDAQEVHFATWAQENADAALLMATPKADAVPAVPIVPTGLVCDTSTNLVPGGMNGSCYMMGYSRYKGVRYSILPTFRRNS